MKRAKRSAAGVVAQQLAVLQHLRQPAAAAVLSWSPRGLRDSPAPRNPDGTYDAAHLVAWRIERLAKPPQEDAAERELARTRRLKADKLQRQAAVELGELLPAAAVRAQLTDVVRLWRAELEAMERVHGGAVGQDLRKCIDRVEGEFKRRWPDPDVEVPQLGPAPADAVQSIAQPAPAGGPDGR